jgi:hypothetical protein
MSLGKHLSQAVGRACVFATLLLLISVTRLALGSDGYTYTKVANFPASNALAICDFAINDNGDVAYVTDQYSGTVSVYSVHLWNPSGADSVVYTGTVQQGFYSAPGVPYCGGFGTQSLALAINNNRLISVQAFLPAPDGTFQGSYGALFVDASTTPATATAVQTPTAFSSTSSLNSSGALGIITLQAGLVAVGSVSPAGVVVTASPDPLVQKLLAPAWTGWYGVPGGLQHSLPAINDNGLVSFIYQDPVSGDPAVLDQPLNAQNIRSTGVGYASSIPLGRIGLSQFGDVGFVTANSSGSVDKVSLLTADRSRVLNYTDSSLPSNPFPYSQPVFPVSLGNLWQITLATTDTNPSTGIQGYSIWSVAADGVPTSIFSALDSSFPVYDPVTGVTTNFSVCQGSSTCVGGNGESVTNGGFIPPSSEMAANAQGATVFYVSDQLAGHLVVATPKPGISVGSPLPPTVHDVASYLMTFTGPCQNWLSSNNGFLSSYTLIPKGYHGPCWVDPPVASAYTLSAAAGADNFESVTIPAPLAHGQTTFTISYRDPTANNALTTNTITAAQTFAFPPGGVSNFTIGGISAAEALQPNNPTAFVLGLTWAKSGALPTDFTMQPLVNSGQNTPPSVSCGAAPQILWPPNGRTVVTTISGHATPGTSPIAATTYLVSDSQSAGQQTGTVAPNAAGTFSFTVPLVAARAGTIMSGRQYTIVVTANDASGNQGSCSAVVTVPHDQGN